MDKMCSLNLHTIPHKVHSAHLNVREHALLRQQQLQQNTHQGEVAWRGGAEKRACQPVHVPMVTRHVKTVSCNGCCQINACGELQDVPQH